MAELVVLDFDGTETADAVLAKLRELRKEHLIDLLDAVVVIHPEGGEVQIKQSVNLTALGASQGMTTGALLGALAGLLVLNPLAGFALGGAAGAAMGALNGRMSDFGINDDFIQELGQTIKPGTSALFVLVAKATTDKVVAEIREHNPRVLKTSLSKEQEDRLREAISANVPGMDPAA
jgi:uncharacterized membrane protein